MSSDEQGDPRPHDLAAERAVLGSMILSAEAATDVATVLSAEDFYRPGHGELFRFLLEWAADGKPADPQVVAHGMAQAGLLTKLGGAGELATMVQQVHTTVNARWYADIVRDKAQRSRCVDLAQRLHQLGTLPDGDTDDVLDRARAATEDMLAPRTDRADSGEWLDELVEHRLTAYERPVEDGVPTGLHDLDEFLVGGGALPGQLVVVASRPGVGKTMLGVEWARKAAAGGVGALFFSLEMSRAEVADRLMSSESGVRHRDITNRQVAAGDHDAIERAAKKLADLPLRVEDEAAITLPHMKSRCRDFARRAPLGIVFVDYLQLMSGTGRAQRREEEVSAISRGLKEMAKQLRVPVVALAQLNREIESRGDGKPKLADLRESGSLEQAADTIMMLTRDDAADKTSPRAGELDIHVTKQRNGPTGTITVAHRAHCFQVRSLAGDAHSGWTPHSAMSR